MARDCHATPAGVLRSIDQCNDIDVVCTLPPQSSLRELKKNR